MPFNHEKFEKRRLEQAIAAQKFNTPNSKEIVLYLINHPSFLDYYALIVRAADPDYNLSNAEQEKLGFLRNLLTEDVSSIAGAVFPQDLAAAELFSHSRNRDEAVALHLEVEPILFANEGPEEPSV